MIAYNNAEYPQHQAVKPASSAVFRFNSSLYIICKVQLHLQVKIAELPL